MSLNQPINPFRVSYVLLSLTLTIFLSGGSLASPDSTHCLAAARFLRTELHMVAEIGHDHVVL